LFIEVNRIPPEGLEIDRALQLQSIAPEGEPSVVEKVRLTGSFRRSGGDVVFRGRIEAVVSLLCSRCATPTTFPIGGECHRVFRPGPIPKPASDREIEEEDLALTPYDGFRIDLGEMAREQIFLLVPLKPLCRETCAGLCRRCGSNRNVEPCDCSLDPQEGDPLTLKLPLNPTTS
jgi:uncharacterized protein